jgi:hypothetical protein
MRGRIRDAKTVSKRIKTKIKLRISIKSSIGRILIQPLGSYPLKGLMLKTTTQVLENFLAFIKNCRITLLVWVSMLTLSQTWPGLQQISQSLQGISFLTGFLKMASPTANSFATLTFRNPPIVIPTIPHHLQHQISPTIRITAAELASPIIQIQTTATGQLAVCSAAILAMSPNFRTTIQSIRLLGDSSRLCPTPTRFPNENLCRHTLPRTSL